MLDPGIVAAVHDLPCCARGLPGARCSGRIEADHAGLHPMGRRSHDTEVIPLDSRCHKDRTNPRTGGDGPFALMTPEQRLDWRAAKIAETQAWYYGRPLELVDLVVVQDAVAAGRSTRGLFLARAA